MCTSLPLSMEKTANDACPLYHYLVVESRGPVCFPEGVGLDITRLRSVTTGLPKRSYLRLKDDCGPLIFLDIRAPYGVQKGKLSTPDCIGLLSRILSLPRAPTEVVADKEPADAASTFLSLLRDSKSYDFPIDESTQPTGLPYKRGKTA
jgi:hypothetical protein